MPAVSRSQYINTQTTVFLIKQNDSIVLLALTHSYITVRHSEESFIRDATNTRGLTAAVFDSNILYNLTGLCYKQSMLSVTDNMNVNSHQ